MLGRLAKGAGLHHLQRRQGGSSSGPSNEPVRNLTTSHGNTSSETQTPAHSTSQKVYTTHNDTNKPAKKNSSDNPSRGSSHQSENSTASHNQQDGKDQVSFKNQTSTQSRIFENQPGFANQTTYDNATQLSSKPNSTVAGDGTSESEDAKLFTASNSPPANSTSTLRDQSRSENTATTSPPTILQPATNSSSVTSSLQMQEQTRPSDTYHKLSGPAICGIVFGILGAVILMGTLGLCLKSYRKKHRHYRNHYHRRNHSSTDSNKAVRDRSSFVVQFGGSDPFAGPPENTRPPVRRSGGFPCGDRLGFNLAKGPNRRPSYLNMYPPDIKPPISAPIMEHPPPLMHRSLSINSAGMPISCISAVLRRMSNNAQTPQGRSSHFREEAWTQDRYHRHGSVLSVKNPDIEDRIGHDDQKNLMMTTAQAQIYHHAPLSSDLHYQDVPAGSTFDSHDPSSPQPQDEEHNFRTAGLYRPTPWGKATSHSFSNESSSFSPEHNPPDLEDGEPIFSGPEIITRTQAAIDAHVSHLSRSTRYSQDSEERLEVESPTDPVVRTATPTSLVFPSFGAESDSRYLERSRHSFQTVPL